MRNGITTLIQYILLKIYLLSALFIFQSTLVLSQSSFYKSIEIADIENIQINLEHAFELEMVNTSEKKVIIEAFSEGEYQNQVFVKTERNEKVLYLKDVVQPFLPMPNDKLSAHKVIALKIKISLPRKMNVTVQALRASLKGNIELIQLEAALESGNCYLNSFVGNATIHTLNGMITIFTKDAVVLAESKTGDIMVKELYGNHTIELKSIRGDIKVYSLKK